MVYTLINITFVEEDLANEMDYNSKRIYEDGSFEADEYSVDGETTTDMNEYQYVLMIARQYFLRDYPDYSVDIKIDAKRH